MVLGTQYRLCLCPYIIVGKADNKEFLKRKKTKYLIEIIINDYNVYEGS